MPINSGTSILVVERILAGLEEVMARNTGISSGYTDEVRKTAWMRYHLAMEKLYNFRPFISMKTYIGMAPEFACPGDIICVIRGAIVPYVLREAPESGHDFSRKWSSSFRSMFASSREFELVGEAYVH